MALIGNYVFMWAVYGIRSSISKGGVHGEEFIQGLGNYFKSTHVIFHIAYKCNTSTGNAYVWGQITEDAVIFIFQLFCICQQDWLYACCPFYDICVVGTCRLEHRETEITQLFPCLCLLTVWQIGMEASAIILSNFLMPRKSTNHLSAA